MLKLHKRLAESKLILRRAWLGVVCQNVFNFVLDAPMLQHDQLATTFTCFYLLVDHMVEAHLACEKRKEKKDQ
jgi:hypothetical protein